MDARIDLSIILHDQDINTKVTDLAVKDMDNQLLLIIMKRIDTSLTKGIAADIRKFYGNNNDSQDSDSEQQPSQQNTDEKPANEGQKTEETDPNGENKES